MILQASAAYAAGEIISTTRDLDKFISGLLGGTLLKPALLAEMRTMYPMAEGRGYGLGLSQVDAGAQCGGAMLGHDGGIPGYISFLLSNADRSKRFEMSVTTGDVDASDQRWGRR
jgi:D-alanyl-D-alanine carboxypeptidase